jgi:hypothetical protein
MSKTIAIDFDGVIHTYSNGWRDGTTYDVPVEGAFDQIKKLLASYCVYIHSTRDSEQILEYVLFHAPDILCRVIPHDSVFWNDVGVLGVSNRKIAAIAYIDDRAIRFTNWRDIGNYFK